MDFKDSKHSISDMKIITKLSVLDGAHILEPGDINIGDEDSFYIYWQNEVRYCMMSLEHDGTIDSIKNLIKNNPDEEIVIYRYDYLSYYRDFEDVLKRMNDLTLTMNRDSKLNQLGI